MKALQCTVFFGLLLASTFQLSYAAEKDSSSLQSLNVVAQTQQATTTDKTAPVTFNADQDGSMQCPAGYALTAVSSTAQQKENVTVYTQCTGVAVALVAHTWCSEAPVNYKVVARAPQKTFTCQKIENEWVNVSHTQSEGGTVGPVRG